MLLLLDLLMRRALGWLGRGSSIRSLELENAVLRHEVRLLRRQRRKLDLRALDRVVLAAASRAIPRDRWGLVLVRPQTLLRWHRELVRRTWTYRRKGKPGPPPIDPEVRAWILRLGRENRRWGCIRIQGELSKAGDPDRGHHDPVDPPAFGSRASLPGAGPELAGVPAYPGIRHPGM